MRSKSRRATSRTTASRTASGWSNRTCSGRSYDLIISNPPYVNAESVAALPPEYQAEPALALGSGEDGLDATRQILAQAKQHLNPGGLLVVEIGHNRDALEAAFPALPFTWLDTAAGDQFVFMLRREEL